MRVKTKTEQEINSELDSKEILGALFQVFAESYSTNLNDKK